MILDRLFTQYKKNDKPLFGSWFLNLHGRIFIGNPKDLNAGVDVVQKEVQRTYYKLPIDRFKPKDKADEQTVLKFRQDNLRLMTLREAERPRVALASSVFAFALIAVLLLAQGMLAGVATSIKKLTASSEERAKIDAEEVKKTEYQSCVDFAVVLIQEDRLNPEQHSDSEKERIKKCMSEHAGFAEEAQKLVNGEAQ